MLIYTERLKLKKLNPTDAEVLFGYRSDPEVYNYQSWLPASVKDAEEFIKTYSNFTEWIPGQWKQLGIYLEKDELIGDVGLHVIDLTEIELGFTIAPTHQRKGYAEEALTGVINSLRVEKGIAKFIGITDPGNIPSISLLKKLGFEQTEHLKKSSLIRGEWKDDLVFKLKV